MDAQIINDLLHSGSIVKHYKAKVGDALRISLPGIPLTKYTQFLRLEKTLEGDQRCFVEEPQPSQEGVLFPRQMLGRAACPGTVRIIWQAVNRLSGEAIPGVKPLEIVVEVEAN
jgi:hypothetical protein